MCCRVLREHDYIFMLPAETFAKPRAFYEGCGKPFQSCISTRDSSVASTR